MTEPLYNVGDLFISDVQINETDLMQDTGILTNREWIEAKGSPDIGYWQYRVRWSKVNWSPRYSQWELDRKVKGDEWTYYPCKPNK